jgi:hypothetical protein
MRRRELVAALAACVVGANHSSAQVAKSRRIGVVLLGGPHFAGLAGLRDGLQAAGLREGASLVVDVRGGTGDLPARAKADARAKAEIVVAQLMREE